MIRFHFNGIWLLSFVLCKPTRLAKKHPSSCRQPFPLPNERGLGCSPSLPERIAFPCIHPTCINSVRPDYPEKLPSFSALFVFPQIIPSGKGDEHEEGQFHIVYPHRPAFTAHSDIGKVCPVYFLARRGMRRIYHLQ